MVSGTFFSSNIVQMDFVRTSTLVAGTIPPLFHDDIRRFSWKLSLPIPVQWCSVCGRANAWDTQSPPVHQQWDWRCIWCKGVHFSQVRRSSVTMRL